VPEDATKVFAIDIDIGTSTGTNEPYAGFATDLVVAGKRSSGGKRALSRLTGNKYMWTYDAASEGTIPSGEFGWDSMTGWTHQQLHGSPNVWWQWKRAPGFFDVVAYNGDGVAGRTVSHNLGVAPEMMWVKKRNQNSNWEVYLHSQGGTKRIYLDYPNAIETTSSAWNNTDATDTVFSLGTSSQTNQSGGTFIAYLFASAPGVSKVGTYTGNGTNASSTNTIDCGFSSGARYVLCKRINAVGNWPVFDAARGIVSGSDPYLYLNLTNAEVNSVDLIDPHSSGFTLVGNYSEWNANGYEYMFYAIA